MLNLGKNATLVFLLISQSVLNAHKQRKQGEYLAEAVCHKHHEDRITFIPQPLLYSYAVVNLGHCFYLLPKHQYLQVRAKEGLPLGVLIVVPHQQIEQRRCLCPQGRQLGDAALKHLTAQGLAQCHTALEEH